MGEYIGECGRCRLSLLVAGEEWEVAGVEEEGEKVPRLKAERQTLLGCLPTAAPKALSRWHGLRRPDANSHRVPPFFWVGYSLMHAEKLEEEDGEKDGHCILKRKSVVAPHPLRHWRA